MHQGQPTTTSFAACSAERGRQQPREHAPKHSASRQRRGSTPLATRPAAPLPCPQPQRTSPAAVARASGLPRAGPAAAHIFNTFPNPAAAPECENAKRKLPLTFQVDAHGLGGRLLLVDLGAGLPQWVGDHENVAAPQQGRRARPGSAAVRVAGRTRRARGPASCRRARRALSSSRVWQRQPGWEAQRRGMAGTRCRPAWSAPPAAPQRRAGSLAPGARPERAPALVIVADAGQVTGRVQEV